MKIAVLTPTFFAYSGIDRVVELQVRALQRHDVTVFCFDGNIAVPNVHVEKIHMPSGSTVSRVYRLLFFLDILRRRTIAEQLAKFDEIHAHFYPMSVLASDAKRLNPDIKVIEHDYGVADPDLFDRWHERVYLRMFRSLSFRYMRRADHVITISHYLASVLERAGITATVQHIQIDKQRFNRKVRGSALRKRLNLGDAPLCFYVGRLSPHKGVHKLIEAYKKAKKRVPDLHLIIGGKATFARYERKLHSLAEAEAGIHFLGFIPDEELPAYYAAANVYTTASLWEGYDMPIAEAAACGTPSVAFAIGAHPEVLTKGKLVKKNDIDAFAAAIVQLVAAPASRTA